MLQINDALLEPNGEAEITEDFNRIMSMIGNVEDALPADDGVFDTEAEDATTLKINASEGEGFTGMTIERFVTEFLIPALNEAAIEGPLFGEPEPEDGEGDGDDGDNESE